MHRIGRTGRAGRSGEAILFVAPRERHMLRAIERATRQQIEPMELPSAEAVNDKRIAKFTQRITDTLGTQDLAFFRDLMVRYQQQHDADPIDIAAALAQMVQGEKPLLIKDVITLDKRPRERERDDDDQPKKVRKTPRAPSVEFAPGAGKELFRVEVGRSHGVQPKNLVGAIANEAGVASANIGRIEIYDEHSTIELPEGMPKDIFMLLKKVWVSGRQLSISRAGGAREKPARKPGFIAKKTKKKSNADTKRERVR